MKFRRQKQSGPPSLLLFLKEPNLIVEAETLLQELDLGSLTPDDFDQVENREIFAAWHEYLKDRENGFDLEEFQSALDAPLQAYLSKRARGKVLRSEFGRDRLYHTRSVSWMIC